MRAITLLSLWQLRNALRSSLTDYRKLIPLLVLLFFVATQVLGALLLGGIRTPIPEEAGELLVERAGTVGTGAFILLGLLALAIVDYGMTEGFLSFSLPDVDYLFTAPISRRLVLAYRLAAKTSAALFQSLFFFYFLIWKPLGSLAPGRASLELGAAALAALFFCLGGYTSLALALKLILGFGQQATIRRWYLGLALAAVALLAYSGWQHGLAGLTNLSRNQVLVAIFYPCRLAADVLVAPLSGAAPAPLVAQLAVFYLLATGLLFSRRENYYEASLAGSERAARMLQAAREQNWAAIFASRTEGRKRSGARPYAVPPLGRGAAALLWANAAAAAKRPGPNLLMPLAGGAALGSALCLWTPRLAAAMAAGMTCYLLFLLTISAPAGYRQSLQRQPLIRPLPFSGWQVIAAEVLPRVVLYSLFSGSVGGALLAWRVPHAGPVAASLLLHLPCALIALHLVQYLTALWYPDAQDRFQQFLSGTVGLFLTTGAVSVLGLALGVPLLLGVPHWVAGILFTLVSLGISAVLLPLIALVYDRFEPRS